MGVHRDTNDDGIQGGGDAPWVVGGGGSTTDIGIA